MKNIYKDDTERELWDSYFSDRSDENRSKLVEYYRPLIRIIVNAYSKGKCKSEVRDDIMQNVAVSMFKSISTFNPEKGRRFNSYFEQRGQGCCKDFFRNIYGRNNQKPQPVSLSTVVDQDQYGEDIFLSDEHEDGHDTPVESCEKRDMWEYLGSLCQDNRTHLMIKLFYRDGLTMRETAATMGITEGRANTLHRTQIALFKQHKKQVFEVFS